VESEGNAWFCRPPELHVDHGAAERRLVLRMLLAELRSARARGEEWVRWIDAGCPPLSESEYERRGRRRGRGSSA
jgi:hypothetical protein